MKAKIIILREWLRLIPHALPEAIVEVFNVPEDLKPVSLNGFTSEDLYFAPSDPAKLRIDKNTTSLPPGFFIPKGDVQILTPGPDPIEIDGKNYSRTAEFEGATIHIIAAETGNRIRFRKKLGMESIIPIAEDGLKLHEFMADPIYRYDLKINPAEEIQEVEFENAQNMTADQIRAIICEYFPADDIEQLLLILLKEQEDIRAIRGRLSLMPYAVESLQTYLENINRLMKKLKAL